MLFTLKPVVARSFLLASALVFTTAISVYAQQNPAPTQERPRRALPTDPEPQEVIKVETDLVPLDVIATDAKGRLVRNLKKKTSNFTRTGSSVPSLHLTSRRSKARRDP